MSDRIYRPKNAEAFDTMLEGVCLLYGNCPGLQAAAIVYGSVAYAFYSGDQDIIIGDIDFIVPSEWFPKIEKAISNTTQFIIEPSPASLRVFYLGNKLSFHDIKNLKLKKESLIKGLINDTPLLFMSRADLISCYEQSLTSGKTEKKQEYLRKISGLK
ncbi:MAG: hypothetical protein IPJ68_02160 [Candidatus Moraniibacteriota bacterium]|nr:MAG: hypothetical protein IPJ68_02160 [Candidatus Moranbacteria bacterium]